MFLKVSKALEFSKKNTQVFIFEMRWHEMMMSLRNKLEVALKIHTRILVNENVATPLGGILFDGTNSLNWNRSIRIALGVKKKVEFPRRKTSKAINWCRRNSKVDEM